MDSKTNLIINNILKHINEGHPKGDLFYLTNDTNYTIFVRQLNNLK